VLLQQRIKNEDMGAKWRNEEFTSLQASSPAGVAARELAAAARRVNELDEPIVVGGGPIE
jgi:NADH-quinone oxidoreductase subunit B